jgi:hypothetical protein
LCTTNLPTPTIGATSTTQANDYFNAVLWTGDTSLSRNITGWDFNLGLLWVKQRSTVRDNWLVDRVRGAQIGLVSNSTSAEATDATATNAFVDSTSPNANGFTAGNGSAVWGGVNSNGGTYVGWAWNAGGSTVTNTSGTISAQVRANTTSGFSIVTYTGNGTAGATVGHGLGVTPDMIIVKSRSVGTADWVVWHSSLTSNNNNYLILNSTAAVNTANQPWNNTLPTSSVFSLRTWDSVNQNSSTYVAYCFDAVAGYSIFTTYTGNGSGDGPFVYCGFRPRYLMIKRYDASGDPWWVIDSARSPYNQTTLALRPNASNAEDSGGNANFDFLSNGFKARTSGGGNGNESGATYIVAAFAESPFKYALAR